MEIGFRTNDKCSTKMFMLAMFIIIPLVGCATTPMETHIKGMESLTEKEYFIPQKPIDRHFIGCAWSKQFGPVEDPTSSDIRIKVERSFDTMQQNFAYNVALSLGGRSTKGATVETGVEGGKARKSYVSEPTISPVDNNVNVFILSLPLCHESSKCCCGSYSCCASSSKLRVVPWYRVGGSQILMAISYVHATCWTQEDGVWTSRLTEQTIG